MSMNRRVSAAFCTSSHLFYVRHCAHTASFHVRSEDAQFCQNDAWQVSILLVEFQVEGEVLGAALAADTDPRVAVEDVRLL